MVLEQTAYAQSLRADADDPAFVLDESLGLYMVAGHRNRQRGHQLAAARVLEEAYTGFCVWNRGNDPATTHTEELRREFVDALDHALATVQPFTPSVALAHFSIDRAVLASVGDAGALLLRGAGYRWLLAGARDSCSLYIEPGDVVLLVSSRSRCRLRFVQELAARAAEDAEPRALVERALPSLPEGAAIAMIRSHRLGRYNALQATLSAPRYGASAAR